MKRLNCDRSAVAAPRLGQLLLARGWISPEDLSDALTAQASPSGGRERLGSILVRRGRLTVERLQAALAEQARLTALAAMLTAVLAAVALQPATARDGPLGRSSTATAKITLVIPERRPGRLTTADPNDQQACLEGGKARAFHSYYGSPAVGPPWSAYPINEATCTSNPRLPSMSPGDRSGNLLVLEPE